MRDGNEKKENESMDPSTAPNEDDATLSVGATNNIKQFVDGIYEYNYDTRNNLKYLKSSTGQMFFIMKDPTDPLYAVEYVNFGEIENTNPAKRKKFGVYTVFSKDIMGRSFSGGGGDTRDNDDESEYNDDNDGNEDNDNVRYANFRRVSKTLRSKQKRGKTLSKNSKTFKKR
jgi:hypothetical protein